MKKYLIWILSCIVVFLWWFNFTLADDYNNIISHVNPNSGNTFIESGNIKEFIIDIAKKIIIPIAIVIWIMIAIFGFYNLAFSDKEDERKKWFNYFIWGTLWIILMVSAWFIANSLVWSSWTTDWTTGIISSIESPVQIANDLYDNILKKFIILAMYLVVGILFVILVVNLIKFVISWDKEEVSKHAKTIIVWNSMWIFFILFAKNIVSMFYSKAKESSNLSLNKSILNNKDLSWLWAVLNYLLGFVAFLITVFIIYQAFLLLTKPEDDATYKNLKKYFLYSLLWVLLIWWVYVIANFFIIK